MPPIRKPVDAAQLLWIPALAAISAGAGFLDAPIPVRTVFGLPLALVLPGWALLIAVSPGPVWPRVERLALAAALSVSISIVVGLGLGLSHGGFAKNAWVLCLAALTAMLTFVAIARGRRVNPAPTPRGRRCLPARKLALASLALCMAAGAIVAGVAGRKASDARDRFSQLWIGKAPDGAVRIGVRNHEGARRLYLLTTTSGNDILELRKPIVLSSGESRTVTVHPPNDRLAVEAVVSLAHAPTQSYRSVWLAQTSTPSGIGSRRATRHLSLSSPRDDASRRVTTRRRDVATRRRR